MITAPHDSRRIRPRRPPPGGCNRGYAEEFLSKAISAHGGRPAMRLQ